MATLRIVDGARRQTLPLAASALVGRGWPCLVRLVHPAAPAYWLELRWFDGTWAWRALTAEARTRGGGAFVANGWRALVPAGGRPPRISLGDDLWIELTDASAPVAFLTDVETGAAIEMGSDGLDALTEGVLELRSDAILPLGADGEPGPPVADGAVLRAGDRMLRAHVPQAGSDTLGGRIDLSRKGVEIEFDEEARVARFSQGEAEVQVRGACVRVLAVYAEARARDLPAGGWLTPDEALAGWRDRGAPPDCHAARVAWERAKLRAQLSRAGAVGLDALYEVRRDGETVRTRLRLQ